MELEPAGYHAVNLFLHLLASALLWRVLRRLAASVADSPRLILALHPVRRGVGGMGDGAQDVLSAVFDLASALAYLRFDPRDRSDAPCDWRTYALASLLFLLVLLSKSVTATLPVALAVVTGGGARGLAQEPVAAPSSPRAGAAVGLFTAWLESTQVAAVGGGSGGSRRSSVGRGGAGTGLLRRALLWPSDLRPSTRGGPSTTGRPGRTPTRSRYSPWPRASAGAVARRARAVAAPLYLEHHVIPRPGLSEPSHPHRYSWVADHFQYLASIAPIALAVTGIARVAAGWSTPLRGSAATALLCLYALLTSADPLLP